MGRTKLGRVGFARPSLAQSWSVSCGGDLSSRIANAANVSVGFATGEVGTQKDRRRIAAGALKAGGLHSRHLAEPVSDPHTSLGSFHSQRADLVRNATCLPKPCLMISPPRPSPPPVHLRLSARSSTCSVQRHASRGNVRTLIITRRCRKLLSWSSELSRNTISPRPTRRGSQMSSMRMLSSR